MVLLFSDKEKRYENVGIPMIVYLFHLLEKRKTRGIAFPGMKKGFSNCFENPAGGEYEIRTREAVTPTRFPSVRHRPLGEFSIHFLLTHETQLE